ncbi:MAG: DUF998 domain-containing protein [Candidatus Thorarchaeota archaeon]
MNLENEKVAGLFLFFGTVQYLFTILILAMVEPSYSISTNFISDLGIGTNAIVFTVTMVIWGGTAAIAAIFLYRSAATEPFFPLRLLALALMVGGLGIVGSGLVPEYSTPGIALHFYLTTVGALSALVAVFLSYKLVNPPFSYVQIFMGGLALLTTILLLSGNDLGIGLGGMERMNAYSFIIWLLSLSGALMNKSQTN